MGTCLKLSLDFYQRDDVVQISRELLGCYLFTSLDGVITGGKITETEAYKGAEDRACHAYLNRRTARTEVMFHPGGVSYVYLCYGMHHLLNIVTNEANIPHAVLIRAIEPLEGVERMLKRRKKNKIDTMFTNGPGKVAQALGIDKKLNGHSLIGETIWIEKGEKPTKIVAGPRIGVDYAGEDAKLPWRFLIS